MFDFKKELLRLEELIWVLIARATSGAITSISVTSPIKNTGSGTAPNIGLTSPARAYGVSGAATLNAGSQVIASATLTPVISGKLKIRVSGVVRNNDTAAGERPVSVAITDGTHTLQTQDTYQAGPVSGGGTLATTSVAFVVDSDHAVTNPETYPLNTPVTINVAITGDASGHLTVAANGVQIEVEEAFA